MPGPVISMPPSLSPMLDIVRGEEGQVTRIELKQDWAAFLQSLQDMAIAQSRYGTTAQRPTSQMQRYVGMPYFDTDLGLPVFLKTASSNAWVKADGTAA